MRGRDAKKNVQKTSHRERELTKSLETMKQKAKEMPRYPEAELWLSLSVAEFPYP
jgi:hypothetical protein